MCAGFAKPGPPLADERPSRGAGTEDRTIALLFGRGD